MQLKPTFAPDSSEFEGKVIEDDLIYKRYTWLFGSHIKRIRIRHDEKLRVKVGSTWNNFPFMLPFLTRVFDVDPVKCVYKAKKYRYLSNVAFELKPTSKSRFIRHVMRSRVRISCYVREHAKRLCEIINTWFIVRDQLRCRLFNDIKNLSSLVEFLFNSCRFFFGEINENHNFCIACSFTRQHGASRVSFISMRIDENSRLTIR